MDIKPKIEEFIRVADRLVADYLSAYSMAPPIHRADYISDKWVRVVTVENGRDSSVYAFICLKDYTTKTLGQLKTGDIHKPATFKVAAKHARGNVFDADFGKCLTPYGPVYLK